MMFVLKACKLQKIGDGNADRWNSPLDILDSNGTVVSKFSLMRAAMFEDIQTSEGSGATALDEIRRLEAGEVDTIESDGNAWIAYITRDKVWFEGLYGQGKGGEVSFAQYKLAVQTNVRFCLTQS
jgi:hypothetical protein